ncbi:MAG: RNA-binding protein [Candidatus Bathyarchaeia archaeon]
MLGPLSWLKRIWVSRLSRDKITRQMAHLGESKLGSKLYVGNLPFTTTEADLRALFEEHGTVDSANVITDRESGRSRGFGFVEFQSESDAQDAQRALDGYDLDGRNLRVNEAQDRKASGGGGGGGGFRR